MPHYRNVRDLPAVAARIQNRSRPSRQSPHRGCTAACLHGREEPGEQPRHPTFSPITFPASLLASVARFPTARSSGSNTGSIWSRILQRCEPSSPIDNHADKRYRHSSWSSRFRIWRKSRVLIWRVRTMTVPSQISERRLILSFHRNNHIVPLPTIELNTRTLPYAVPTADEY